MLFTVSDVVPEALAHVWPKVLPMVKRGLRHGQGDSLRPEDIMTAIQSGEMRMWAVHKDGEVWATVVFRILLRPSGRVMFIVMLAGRDIDAWADELEQMLLDYRDIIGATKIEASCRLGLAEYLGKRGWKRSAVIMRAPE